MKKFMKGVFVAIGLMLWRAIKAVGKVLIFVLALVAMWHGGKLVVAKGPSTVAQWALDALDWWESSTQYETIVPMIFLLVCLLIGMCVIRGMLKRLWNV